MISGIRNSGGGQKGDIGQKGERGIQGNIKFNLLASTIK